MNAAVTVAHAPLNAQAQHVLRELIERGSLTPRDAMAFGCYRLAARVLEIREAFGAAAVVTEYEDHDGGRHARYQWRGGSEQQGDLFFCDPGVAPNSQVHDAPQHAESVR